MNANTASAGLNHVAIIMDGNGRWAEARGLPRVVGHRAGVKTLRKLIEYAVEICLKVITVYAFSRENWQRPDKEIGLLMELFMSSLNSEVKDLNENNVKLQFIGERTRFSEKLQQAMTDAEQFTASNTGLILNIAVNYSGQWDILEACRSVIKDVQEKGIDPTAIDETYFNDKLCLTDLNAPDLFIRTGGEQRLSNYFLWQLAYTELYFTDTLWPDFDSQQFAQALDWYTKRQRRFGKTPEQVEPSKRVR